MPLPIAIGQLAAPSTPKLKDNDVERMRIEFERKIVELQGIVRKLAARVP